MRIIHLAHIVLEAVTPMKVASGEKSFETDSLIIKDIYHLPFIPASSLAGVIRANLTDGPYDIADLFGPIIKGKDTSPKGSRILFTDARLCDASGCPIDGLRLKLDSEFLDEYQRLPIRQHVRIDSKGTAEDTGKFDEQVVFKGSRFCFEVKIYSDCIEEQSILRDIIDNIHSGNYRFGGGTRKGFGKLIVIGAKIATLNLENETDLKKYLDKPSSLAEPWNGWEEYSPNVIPMKDQERLSLELSPEDFFLFSSGFQSESGDANMAPVKEKIIVWKNGTGSFKEQCLIPATSIKGALAHRTAYHYNRILKKRGESTGNGANAAVRELFGYVEEKKSDAAHAKIGKIIIEDDVFFDLPNVPRKFMNHVVIDPHSGGTTGGGLFTEEVLSSKCNIPPITILITNKSEISDDAMQAFRRSVRDLQNGFLPLGGGTNRGNGIFKNKQ